MLDGRGEETSIFTSRTSDCALLFGGCEPARIGSWAGGVGVKLPAFALKPDPGNLLAMTGFADVGVPAPLDSSAVFSRLLTVSTRGCFTLSSFAVIVSDALFDGTSVFFFCLDWPDDMIGFLGSGFGGSSVDEPAPELDPLDFGSCCRI